ncbi:MAG: PPC domain-containing DNA-binding protein [Mucilaginibacter sp.]
MKTRSLLIGFILTTLFISAKAQQYVSPTTPPQTGRSPGVKVKLISSNSSTKTYCLVFAEGDEILSGLKEFAVKYKVTSAHFVGIGDAGSSKFGWYDKTRKMFKVNELHNFAEITSLAGDITLSKGNPVVHAHINLATEDGLVHGGHLLEAFVNPTLQVIVTVEPIPLYKRLDEASGIMIIDPDLKK